MISARVKVSERSSGLIALILFNSIFSNHSMCLVNIIVQSASGKPTDFESVIRWFDPSLDSQETVLLKPLT